MAFSQIVKTHIQPTVKMIELQHEDNSAESETPSVTKQNKNLPDASQSLGAKKPFIRLAGQVVTEIDRLTIDETGFMPTITLIFTDPVGEFSGAYFPKKNLMVSIYIASSTEKLKPVRSDYLVTSVKTIPPPNRSNSNNLAKGITYLIKGELFVPRVYNNISKSYPGLTSIDALKEVCTSLGIGYAQNEFATNDKMTWINYNTSPLNFMKELVSYTYQDDDSFFNGFINKELIFNLINVEEQLKGLEVDQTFLSAADSLLVNLNQQQKNNPEKESRNEATVDNYLNNLPDNSGKPSFIQEANIISDQGGVLRKDGYKKQIFYYDHFESDETKKFKDFFVAPNNTPGLSEDSMLIPEDEGLSEVGNKKWMNINYGNTHEHWNAARVFNTHNMKELEKIKLRVLLKGINNQVIRGSVVPVVLTQRFSDKIRKERDVNEPATANLDQNRLDDIAMDTELSGRYWVKGAIYHYDPMDPLQFSTELILARREWSPSKTKFTANA
jgi:hypothetical protein